MRPCSRDDCDQPAATTQSPCRASPFALRPAPGAPFPWLQQPRASPAGGQTPGRISVCERALPTVGERERGGGLVPHDARRCDQAPLIYPPGHVQDVVKVLGLARVHRGPESLRHPPVECRGLHRGVAQRACHLRKHAHDHDSVLPFGPGASPAPRVILDLTMASAPCTARITTKVREKRRSRSASIAALKQPCVPLVGESSPTLRQRADRCSAWRSRSPTRCRTGYAGSRCVQLEHLSVGSGVIVIFAVWAHLTASAHFRAGPLGPYPAGYPKRPAGGQVTHLGFPLPYLSRRGVSTTVRGEGGCVRALRGTGLRAGARPYFGPRLGVGSRVGDKMFDGVIPLGEALRPLNLSRPYTRACRQQQ